MPRQRTFEAQAEQLGKTFGACLWVCNEGLALLSGAWEQHRVNVGFAETCRALTGWKQAEERAWLKEVSSTVLQQSLRHLDQAFTRFIRDPVASGSREGPPEESEAESGGHRCRVG